MNQEPGNASDGDEAIGLREFLSVLFKRKSTILVTFLTVVATVTVGTFLLPPTYEAQARLLVKVGRENVYRSEVGGDTSQILSVNNEEIVNSETNILTSRDLIEKVVSTLTVQQLYPDLAKSPPRRGTPARRRGGALREGPVGGGHQEVDRNSESRFSTRTPAWRRRP